MQCYHTGSIQKPQRCWGDRSVKGSAVDRLWWRHIIYTGYCKFRVQFKSRRRNLEFHAVDRQVTPLLGLADSLISSSCTVRSMRLTLLMPSVQHYLMNTKIYSKETSETYLSFTRWGSTPTQLLLSDHRVKYPLLWKRVSKGNLIGQSRLEPSHLCPNQPNGSRKW